MNGPTEMFKTRHRVVALVALAVSVVQLVTLGAAFTFWQDASTQAYDKAETRGFDSSALIPHQEGIWLLLVASIVLAVILVALAAFNVQRQFQPSTARVSAPELQNHR